MRSEKIVALPVPAIISAQASEPVVEKCQVRAKLQAGCDAMAARDGHVGADRRATLIEMAVQDLWMTRRCSGRTAFFALAAAVNRAGLDASEIREKLWEEAAYGHSPRKRGDEIKDILKSLGRRGTLAGAGKSSWNWWD